jgi:hypothetical protein
VRAVVELPAVVGRLVAVACATNSATTPSPTSAGEGVIGQQSGQLLEEPAACPRAQAAQHNVVRRSVPAPTGARPLQGIAPEKATHNYLEPTPRCSARPEVVIGKVVDACQPPHRHQEFLRSSPK